MDSSHGSSNKHKIITDEHTKNKIVFLDDGATFYVTRTLYFVLEKTMGVSSIKETN